MMESRRKNKKFRNTVSGDSTSNNERTRKKKRREKLSIKEFMKILPKEYEFSDRKGIPYTEHN